MKINYQAPEIKVIDFDLESKIMNGYSDGDDIENPWVDDDDSATDTTIKGN